MAARCFRMFAALLAAVALVGGLAPSKAVAGDEGSYTPPKGSATRTALMNAIRPPVESRVGSKVIFRVDHLMVDGDYCYAIAECLKPAKGKSEGVPFKKDTSLYAEALLKRDKSGAWSVLRIRVASTGYDGEKWTKEFPAAHPNIFLG